MPFKYISGRMRSFNYESFTRHFSVEKKALKVRDTQSDTPRLFEEFITDNINIICDAVLIQTLLDLERIKKCPELWVEKFRRAREGRDDWTLRDCDLPKEFREEVLDSISYKGMEIQNQALYPHKL